MRQVLELARRARDSGSFAASTLPRRVSPATSHEWEPRRRVARGGRGAGVRAALPIGMDSRTAMLGRPVWRELLASAEGPEAR